MRARERRAYGKDKKENGQTALGIRVPIFCVFRVRVLLRVVVVIRSAVIAVVRIYGGGECALITQVLWYAKSQ